MQLDPKRTALLTLDFQHGIISQVKGSDACLSAAGKAVAFARDKNIPVIHVGLGFDEGHPEIPDTSAFAARIKANNLFVKGSPSAAFHASLTKPGDSTVYKQRVSAFSDNALHMILRAKGVDQVVFFGIATSGIVLSTLRRAFDLDFQSVVLKDACFDADEEVHRVLTDKVFVRQATVLTVDAFVAEQG